MIMVQNQFRPGDLVQHRRYGYRGVVVALDACCMATDEWYQKNRTRPSRQQAWYHVLVHGSPHSTYAAQDSLLPDPGGEPVDHPFVTRFFGAFRDGRYVRNDTPWPGA